MVFADAILNDQEGNEYLLEVRLLQLVVVPRRLPQSCHLKSGTRGNRNK